jgi:hypothetical protein
MTLKRMPNQAVTIGQTRTDGVRASPPSCFAAIGAIGAIGAIRAIGAIGAIGALCFSFFSHKSCVLIVSLFFLNVISPFFFLFIFLFYYFCFITPSFFLVIFFNT